MKNLMLKSWKAAPPATTAGVEQLNNPRLLSGEIGKSFLSNTPGETWFKDLSVSVTRNNEIVHYTADITSSQDYYPFGSLMHGRSFSSNSYRFGFQGQEKDDEITGTTGSHLAFKYRVHDARIGRFLSIDPLSPEYPWNSPYAFSENRVIDSRELEGLERVNATEYAAEKGDSFEGLDKKLGYKIGTMQSLNQGIEPKSIQIGQILQTPITVPYMAKGQTNINMNTGDAKYTPTQEKAVYTPPEGSRSHMLLTPQLDVVKTSGGWSTGGGIAVGNIKLSIQGGAGLWSGKDIKYPVSMSANYGLSLGGYIMAGVGNLYYNDPFEDVPSLIRDMEVTSYGFTVFGGGEFGIGKNGGEDVLGYMIGGGGPSVGFAPFGGWNKQRPEYSSWPDRQDTMRTILQFPANPVSIDWMNRNQIPDLDSLIKLKIHEDNQ